MPPAAVGVVTVQPSDVPLVTELPGRLEAWRTAQVRARVPGIVARRLFTEGSEVRAGTAMATSPPTTKKPPTRTNRIQWVRKPSTAKRLASGEEEGFVMQPSFEEAGS